MKFFKGLFWACPISLVLWALLFYAASMIFDLGMFETVGDFGTLEKQEQGSGNLKILDSREAKDMGQMVKIEKHKLEALASCVESCAVLCRGVTGFDTGQRPEEMLMEAAQHVKSWLKNSCENAPQSKE